MISASTLYDFIQCPHRVYMDKNGKYADRDAVSPFIELLWEKGNLFEREVIESLDVPFVDLSNIEDNEDREKETRLAIERGEVLIYHGRLTEDDLVGEPDLLRKQNGGYVAGDIKSGAGLEGASDNSDGKPKKHYAVQLALYTELLERIGCSAGRTPFVWDIHGEEILYQLEESQGARTPETWWELYERIRDDVMHLTSGDSETLPAASSICKLCHWRSFCKKELQSTDDLTLIPDLGRSNRDKMITEVPTVSQMATVELKTLPKFSRIGQPTLEKYQARAILLSEEGASPYLTKPLNIPEVERELHFDIENDPMRDIVYLHGFVERISGDNDNERFVTFIAEEPTPEEECRAFAEAWAFIQSSKPCLIFYYSKHERTFWRKLQEKYPEVVSAEDIEIMFDPAVAIDLYYDVVNSQTVWPTHDHSIKTLAQFLGFNWRDSEPSGAASIEWYNQWIETGDAAIRQRILDYNEDDCRATRVLLDGLRNLPLYT